MLLTGSSTETYTDSCCDVVNWTTCKAHLRLNTDDEKSIVLTYLCGAVGYCEQYLNRPLAYKTVKMYYHNPRCWAGTFTFQLRYYIDVYNTDFTVMVTDADGDEVPFTTFKPIQPDLIQIDPSDLPEGWLMISIEYRPRVYEQVAEVVPAVLMKLGEIYYNRDGSINQPKISGILSILNRHRVKRHA